MIPPAPNMYTRAESRLLSRIAAALAVPWMTSYVAPTSMMLSGVVYALRGYEVRWSEPRVAQDHDGDWTRSPSCLSYACFVLRGGDRSATHGVEVSCVLPDAVVRAEARVRRLLVEVTRG